MRADARLRVGWGQKPDTRLAETTGRVHAGARNGEAGARDGKAGKVSHGDGETHSHGRVVVLGVEAGAEGDVGGVGHEENKSEGVSLPPQSYSEGGAVSCCKRVAVFAPPHF